MKVMIFPARQLNAQGIVAGRPLSSTVPVLAATSGNKGDSAQPRVQLEVRVKFRAPGGGGVYFREPLEGFCAGQILEHQVSP